MNESIQAFVETLSLWISQHPTWAGLVVFLISLAESLVGIGLLIPGVVMMTGIGILMGNGVLPLWGTLGWAILGAIAGDGISYWVGYHYHGRLREIWPFKAHPLWLERGERFFSKHGGKSIILGRFIGPVRPMIPVIAGMMDMKPRVFLLFNVISAILWAPLYSLPGILLGASLGALTPEIANRLILLILLVLLLSWLLYTFVLSFFKTFLVLSQRFLDRLFRYWQTRPVFVSLRNLLINKQMPRGPQQSPAGQLGAFSLFILSLSGFFLIMHSVLNQGFMLDWNQAINQALRAFYWDKIILGVGQFTHLAEPLILILMSTLFGLYLFLKRQIITGLCWLGTIGTGTALGYLCKYLIPIKRPESLLIYYSTKNSFPSGHTLMMTLFLGFAALLIRTQLPRSQRAYPVLVSALLILSIAFSRLYLEQHWFSDIIGSLLLATAVLSLGWLLYRRFEPEPPQLLKPFIVLFVLTIGSAWFYNLRYHHLERPHFERYWVVNQFKRQDWWSTEYKGFHLSYRQGAFKREASLFDLQWLGDLPRIRQELQDLGFVLAPPLNWLNTLSVLSSHPSPASFPIFPKYHRDRLPVLSLIKPLSTDTRLVIQLWHSDHESTDSHETLWVGTIRYELLKKPIPFITLYREQVDKTPEALRYLYQDLEKIEDLESLRLIQLPLQEDNPIQAKRVLLIQAAP